MLMKHYFGACSNINIRKILIIWKKWSLLAHFTPTYTYLDILSLALLSSHSNTTRGPTGGWSTNPTPTCHVHLDWSLLLVSEMSVLLRPVTCIYIGIKCRNIRASPPCCARSIPACKLSRASRSVSITRIYARALLSTREPSLLANSWPGNLAQVSMYSTIRLVHEGVVKFQKAGTPCFPSGLDTGRVFVLYQ